LRCQEAPTRTRCRTNNKSGGHYERNNDANGLRRTDHELGLSNWENFEWKGKLNNDDKRILPASAGDVLPNV